MTTRRESDAAIAPTLASEATSLAKDPAVSFVTSVFNRLWQLRKTLPGNLRTIRAQRDVDLVLVDFGGEDSKDIRQLLESEFASDLLSGKLKYFVANVPWSRFHIAIAKNVAHRLSTGAFVFSLDADNHFTQEDLHAVREHLEVGPSAVLHQTTGPAPLRHRSWSRYALFNSPSDYHDQPPTWNGSCGRIGIARTAFERVNGYNENFVGMGMDDIDFLIRAIRTGSTYRHVRLLSPHAEVFVDNGSADIAYEHENNQQNWRLMDKSILSNCFVPVYENDSTRERFVRIMPPMVGGSTGAFQ